MDGLTLVGIIIAFMAIIIGQMIEGGSINSLLNLPALLIVLGGTLGAVMIQSPVRTFLRAFRILPWIFFPPVQPYEQSRIQLVELSRKSRQFGLLSLEEHLNREANPLLAQGLELLVVGVDKQNIRQVLETEIDRNEERDMHAASVFESMGGYSPTIGILGAVLGLIQVMSHLSDPAALGTGIAVAFVATIYGVGMANLLFLPIAHKLKACIQSKVHHDEMLIEGIVSMASGESPNVLNLKLNNYGSQHQHARTTKE